MLKPEKKKTLKIVNIRLFSDFLGPLGPKTPGTPFETFFRTSGLKAQMTPVNCQRYLGCRKWGCNNRGLRGVCLPFLEIGLFRPFSAFIALFLKARTAPGNSRKQRKKAYRVHAKGVVLCERTCFCLASLKFLV